MKMYFPCGARITLVALLSGLAAGLAGPATAGAQVTAHVPLEARSYDHVGDLLAAGLGTPVAVGQRPWSRLAFAHMAVAARAALVDTLRGPGAAARKPGAAARLERIIRELEAEFAPEIAGLAGAPDAKRQPFDGGALELLALDSPARGIENVGLGETDALINPLAQGRGARTYSQGLTAAAEAAASLEFTRHLAVAAHGRLHTASGHADLRALNATAGARNVVLQVGRVPVLLGQGVGGGLFSSSNAPGLDMVRIGTDRPARLPWILGRLGPATGTLFVADLGAAQHYPHTKMAGWKMSFLPSPRFEIGASLMSIQGGEGAPPARFAERVVDVFTIVDVLFYQDRDLLFSNKLAGFDMRARVAGMELFLDVMTDDFDVRRVRSSLWEDTGYNVGVVLPRLGPDGSLRLDAEYQHTGLRFYEHGLFRSGVAVRRQFLGLPLGPRGNAVHSRLRWDPLTGHNGQVGVALERRSGDHYVISTGPNDSDWKFIKSDDRPEETRARVLVGYGVEHGSSIRIEVEGGYERVLNAGFSSASTDNMLGRVGLVIGFR